MKNQELNERDTNLGEARVIRTMKARRLILVLFVVKLSRR